jgi:hypothetical protein
VPKTSAAPNVTKLPARAQHRQSTPPEGVKIGRRLTGISREGQGILNTRSICSLNS